MHGLPSLHRLSLNGKCEGVDASWAWDPGSYQVRFSVDVAVVEQIDGLGHLTNTQSFVPKSLTNRPHQLNALAVLRVAIEYTIQRIWDVECAVPWIDVDENRPPNPDKEAPFVDTSTSLIREVARMTLAVKNTLTAEQAQTEFAQRQREKLSRGFKRPRRKGFRQSERQKQQSERAASGTNDSEGEDEEADDMEEEDAEDDDEGCSV